MPYNWGMAKKPVRMYVWESAASNQRRQGLKRDQEAITRFGITDPVQQQRLAARRVK